MVNEEGKGGEVVVVAGVDSEGEKVAVAVVVEGGGGGD